MKHLNKNTLSFAAVLSAILFGAAAFCACDIDNGSVYSAAFDSGSSKLDPPEVTARAWPGVNIITWTAVPAAASYNIYKDGNAPINQTALSFSDVDIVNGQTHKYTVEAVFSLKSEANVIGTATTVYLKGIRPPAGTAEDTALNLAAYEGGTDGVTRAKANQNDARYLAPARIKAYAGNGVICAEFPGKPYLTYKVQAALASDPTFSGDIVMKELFLSDQNYKLGGSVLPILKGGEWKISVVAEALNQAYRPSEAVTASSNVNIESLPGVVATPSLYAVYTSASNVRVAWVPATDALSVFYPEKCYTVYKQSVDAATGMKSWTLVSGAIGKATLAGGATYYYVDDAAAGGTAESLYALVISQDYKYGDAVKQTVPVYAGSSMALTLSTASATSVSVNTGSAAYGETPDVFYCEYATGPVTDDPYLAGINTSSWTQVTLAEHDETAPGATTKTYVNKGTATSLTSRKTYLFRLRVSKGSAQQISYQFFTVQ